MFLPHAPPRCKVVCFLWPKKTPVALVANATQHSTAQQRPDLGLHLPSVTVAVALPLWVKWAASFAFAFAFAVALPPVGGTIKKVQARISLRTTLCRPARFNTCVFINTHIHTYILTIILCFFIYSHSRNSNVVHSLNWFRTPRNIATQCD